MVWSLLDFATQQRTPKDSARYYAKAIGGRCTASWKMDRDRRPRRRRSDVARAAPGARVHAASDPADGAGDEATLRTLATLALHSVADEIEIARAAAPTTPD